MSWPWLRFSCPLAAFRGSTGGVLVSEKIARSGRGREVGVGWLVFAICCLLLVGWGTSVLWGMLYYFYVEEERGGRLAGDER